VVKNDPEIYPLVEKCRGILAKEDQLVPQIQSLGKDSLDKTEQLTIDMARLIREDFFQQNQFTPYDKFCSKFKSLTMLRNIISYYELGLKELEGEQSYAPFKSRSRDLIYSIYTQKFVKSKKSEKEKLENVSKEIEAFFKK